MKKVFYTLIFIFFAFFSTTAHSETIEETCKGLMRPPRVRILTSYGKLRYDFSKSSRTLTRMHLRQYGGNIAAGKRVHGLATHELTMEVAFKLQKNTLPNGASCIYPLNVDLLIGVKKPIIYISQDLTEGSCAYNLAMRHEQTHQQINIDVLEYYLPIIQKRFLKIVKDKSLIAKPFDYNLELAKENLKATYSGVIDPLMAEIESEIKTEQAKLDSPQNYEYEELICK